MNDVWNERITTIMAGLKDLLVALAAIIAAWQAMNNNAEIKTVKEQNDRLIARP